MPSAWKNAFCLKYCVLFERMPSFWKNAFRLKEYVPFEKIPSVRCVLLERMRSVCKYAFHVKVKKKKKLLQKKNMFFLEHVLFRACTEHSFCHSECVLRWCVLQIGTPRGAKFGRPSKNRKAFRKSERVLKIGRRVLSDVAVSPNRTCSYSDVAFRFRWP